MTQMQPQYNVIHGVLAKTYKKLSFITNNFQLSSSSRKIKLQQYNVDYYKSQYEVRNRQYAQHRAHIQTLQSTNQQFAAELEKRMVNVESNPQYVKLCQENERMKQEYESVQQQIDMLQQDIQAQTDFAEEMKGKALSAMRANAIIKSTISQLQSMMQETQQQEQQEQQRTVNVSNSERDSTLNSQTISMQTQKSQTSGKTQTNAFKKESEQTQSTEILQQQSVLSSARQSQDETFRLFQTDANAKMERIESRVIMDELQDVQIPDFTVTQGKITRPLENLQVKEQTIKAEAQSTQSNPVPPQQAPLAQTKSEPKGLTQQLHSLTLKKKTAQQKEATTNEAPNIDSGSKDTPIGHLPNGSKTDLSPSVSTKPMEKYKSVVHITQKLKSSTKPGVTDGVQQSEDVGEKSITQHPRIEPETSLNESIYQLHVVPTGQLTDNTLGESAVKGQTMSQSGEYALLTQGRTQSRFGTKMDSLRSQIKNENAGKNFLGVDQSQCMQTGVDTLAPKNKNQAIVSANPQTAIQNAEVSDQNENSKEFEVEQKSTLDRIVDENDKKFDEPPKRKRKAKKIISSDQNMEIMIKTNEQKQEIKISDEQENQQLTAHDLGKALASSINNIAGADVFGMLEGVAGQ